MSLLRHLPNALTCSNLICGVLGIITLHQIDPIWWLIAAGVFDFLDGFVARLLKVSSPIGKELDSLADLVTWGVLPSVYWYYAIDHEYWRYVTVLIAVFSALRLAQFNIDERQTEGFIGVPTPANGLFLIALPYLFADKIVPLAIAIPVILLSCWLMVCPLRLFGLKFKNFNWKGNELRFTFLIAAVLLIGIFQVAGVALTIILYILASLITGWRRAGTVS